MCKDLAAMDYDMIEENFVALKQAHVLVADYDLLRKDFAELKVGYPSLSYLLIAHKLGFSPS